MLEKCVHYTIDSAVAGALMVATSSTVFWQAEQRATIEVGTLTAPPMNLVLRRVQSANGYALYVNRHAKLTHLFSLTSAQNCAEERAGVIDGKRVEDPTMGVGRGA